MCGSQTKRLLQYSHFERKSKGRGWIIITIQSLWTKSKSQNTRMNRALAQFWKANQSFVQGRQNYPRVVLTRQEQGCFLDDIAFVKIARRGVFPDATLPPTPRGVWKHDFWKSWSCLIRGFRGLFGIFCREQIIKLSNMFWMTLLPSAGFTPDLRNLNFTEMSYQDVDRILPDASLEDHDHSDDQNTPVVAKLLVKSSQLEIIKIFTRAGTRNKM